MLLSPDTLALRHLPDVPVDEDGVITDATAAAALTGLLGALEQLGSVWLGYPSCPADPEDGALVKSTWESRDYVLYPRPVAGRLVLPVAPITTITTILLSSSSDWMDDGTLPADVEAVAATDYNRERLAGGELLWPRSSGLLGGWPIGRRTIRVVCTAGYEDEAALPAGVADALYRAAADVYLRRRVRVLQSASQSGTSQTFTELKALPQDVKDILAPYRLLNVLGVA